VQSRTRNGLDVERPDDRNRSSLESGSPQPNCGENRENPEGEIRDRRTFLGLFAADAARLAIVCFQVRAGSKNASQFFGRGQRVARGRAGLKTGWQAKARSTLLSTEGSQRPAILHKVGSGGGAQVAEAVEESEHKRRSGTRRENLGTARMFPTEIREIRDNDHLH
jgi:hypothetical protein